MIGEKSAKELSSATRFIKESPKAKYGYTTFFAVF